MKVLKLFEVAFLHSDTNKIVKDFIVSNNETLGAVEQEFLKDSQPGTEVHELKFMGLVTVGISALIAIKKAIQEDAQYKHLDNLMKPIEVHNTPENKVWVCVKCGRVWTEESCGFCKETVGEWISYEEFEQHLNNLKPSAPDVPPKDVPTPPKLDVPATESSEAEPNPE